MDRAARQGAGVADAHEVGLQRVMVLAFRILMSSFIVLLLFRSTAQSPVIAISLSTKVIPRSPVHNVINTSRSQKCANVHIPSALELAAAGHGQLRRWHIKGLSERGRDARLRRPLA